MPEAEICKECHALADECDFWDGECSGPYPKRIHPGTVIVSGLFLLSLTLAIIVAIRYYL